MGKIKDAVKKSPKTKIERIQESEKPREQTISELQDAIQQMNMKINEAEINLSNVNFDVEGDFIAVVGVSDLHYGNQNVNMDFVEKLLTFIEKHPRAYCFLNGDIIDNWVKLAPSGGIYEQSIKPEFQLEIMTEKIKPIKDKVLGITYGNHEGRSQKSGEEEPMSRMAKELDIPYLGPGGRINLKFGDNIYNMHVRHRFRYESSFNPTHACGRLIEQLDADADIVAIGHKHDPAVEVRFKAGKQRSLMRFGSAVPSTRYSDYLGFGKSPLVAPSVILSGEEKMHHPFIDIGIVAKYISYSENEDKSMLKKILGG